jgi:hypothetical protein
MTYELNLCSFLEIKRFNCRGVRNKNLNKIDMIKGKIKNLAVGQGF